MEVGIEKLNVAILKKDEGIDFQKGIIENNEKQVKRAKRSANFWKLATLVLTGVLGYEILK